MPHLQHSAPARAVRAVRRWWSGDTTPYTSRAAVVATCALALFYINAVVSARDVGLGVHGSLSKDRLAEAIEKIPERRRAMLNNAFHQGKISGYRQQLELQILQEIKPETAALAGRIRSISKEQWWRMWGEQGYQTIAGKFAGKTIAVAAENLNPATVKTLFSMADNLYNAGFSVKSAKDALAGAKRKLEPNLDEKQRLLAMKIQHILDTTLKAHQHEIMAAKFRLVILGLKKSYCTESEKTYQEKLRRQAQYYSGKWLLTQAAGSKDSIWRDWTDFQGWLHERMLEQADEDCKKEEEPKGLALTEKDCPRDVRDIKLVFHEGEKGRVRDDKAAADVIRCIYYEWFKDTGKQKPGVSFFIGDTMFVLLRFNSRDAALSKYSWAMDLARRNIKKATKDVTAELSEETPSRDELVITGKVLDASPTGPMYVKYAAFRYKNCIILAHTHRSRDQQWLIDLVKGLRKKFEALVDEKG